MGGVQFPRAASGPISNLIGLGVASFSEFSKGWGVSVYGASFKPRASTYGRTPASSEFLYRCRRKTL